MVRFPPTQAPSLLVVIFPSNPSNVIFTFESRSFATPLEERNIFWIVMAALLRLVGMLSHAAHVTPAKRIEVIKTDHSTSAEVFELK